MLRLRHAKLCNWMQCREAELTFPEFGVVRIIGINHTAHGKMESVGSGKSGLGDAIHRVTFGVNREDFSSLKDYSTDEGGGTLVSLTFDLNGKELNIVSGYKHSEISGRGEGLRFTYDGVTVERDHIRETRKELASTIGVLPELAAWTCCLDGDRMKFNGLSQGDRVSLIMNAVRAPDWDKLHTRAKKTAATLKEEETRAEEQLRSAREAVAEAEESVEEAEGSLKSAQTTFDRAVQNRQTVIEEAEKTVAAKLAAYDRAESDAEEAKSAIAEFEKKNAELVGTLEKDRLALKSKVQAKRDARKQAEEKRANARAARRAAKQKIEELKEVPTNCPTCGKTWDSKVSPKAMQSAQAALATATEAEEKADDEYSKADGELSKIEDELEEKNDEISRAGKSEMTRLSRAYEAARSAANNASAAALSAKQRLETAKIPPSDSAIVAARATLDDRKKACDRVKASLEEKANNLAEAEVASKVGQYMVTACGPSGMPNMILEDVAPELNARSRTVSEALTGGTLLVRFETTKTLGDGREQAELITKLDNRYGSKNAKGGSKGERGLTNLIIAETLSAVSSMQTRVAYRWLDEVINNLDHVVRKGFLQRLREEAHRNRSLVFIVDHHSGVEAVADHTLLAQKWPDNRTTYEWV